MNIENEIREIVAEILQIPAEELDTSASFFDEYGIDSRQGGKPLQHHH